MSGKSRVARVATWLLVLFLAPQLPIAPARADSVTRDNIDIYILVDESTSLSQNDVQLERDAVESIVTLQTIKKRGIRVGIVPFSSGSSSPRVLSGCDLVPVDDGNDMLLAECAKKITRQFNDSGNTDFAGAFNFVADAVEEIGERDRIPVIILLTDGINDPDGNEETSIEEADSLDRAVGRLKAAGIPIWSIGFGQADLEALSRYSNMTQRTSSNCDANANARIVEKDNLAIQLKVIVGEATCSDVSAPEPIPSKRFVHPLIDTVVVTVSTGDGNPPSLSSPKGQSLCSDGFNEISEKVFQCTIAENGNNPGIWTVDAGPRSLVTWEFFGNVLLEYDSCPNPSSLKLGRLDGNPVDFDSADLWPSVEVSLDGVSRGVVVLDSESIQITEALAGSPKTGLLKAEAVTGSRRSGLPRLNVKPAVCDLAAPPAPSTTVPPTTTVPPPPEPSCEEQGNCPPPLWPWVILGLFAIGGGIGLFRWRRSKYFPAGTILTQQSPVNDRAWLEPIGDLGSDIGETKKVAIAVDRVTKKISADRYGAACDYVLSNSRGQILIESFSEVVDDGQTTVSSTSRLEPFGMSIQLEQGVVIRVEKPDASETEETS